MGEIDEIKRLVILRVVEGEVMRKQYKHIKVTIIQIYPNNNQRQEKQRDNIVKWSF